MRNPYELAKDILQTTEVSGRFTSIGLYGASVCGNDAGEGTCHYFHLENESGTGDLSFCSLQDNSHQSEFPTSHYHGITVTVDFSMITEEMKKILVLLSVDLERILELSRRQEFTIIRANPTIEHIFSELYTVPGQIRPGYIRVKILELL